MVALQRAEMRMARWLRWMHGIKLKDRFPKEEAEREIRCR